MVSNNGNPHQSSHYIPSDLLDDLCSRFIINLPPDDRWDLVRVCFHVEMAHWFFLDNYCNMYNLRSCGQKTFAGHIFNHIPELNKHIINLDTILENWREYKRKIPTYGAILLDEDLSHVLLVQSFYAKTSWGFPKGKVNEDEKPWNCAAREVLEETGFDISMLINKSEYINAIVNGQTIQLYIITNVPRDTYFQPRTQNEIKSCEWFKIDDLPSNKKDMTQRVSHKYFPLVIPFVKKIRRWVSTRNAKERTRGSLQKSMNSIEFSTTETDIGISHALQNALTNYQEQNFSTQDFQDAFRKYQQKNFPTQEPQNDFMQYPHQDLSTQELQIAYKKYLQHNQPSDKLLNMPTKNQQQNLPYYKYQDGQLYQVQNSPMTPNNSQVWSTNTSENNLSNIEKYYQQDLPTQQLRNALMIYEQQDFPYSEYQKSQLYQEQGSPNNSHDWNKNTSETSLSNLEKYYQQDLPTQQLRNALMIYEQQDFPYSEYQKSQLYQEQGSPNNSHDWNKNSSETSLSNLEKYYQQDLPTQQLKNALMIYEQKDFPYFEYQESQLYQKHCSPNNSYDWSKNTCKNNLSMNERKLAAGIQLLKPSDFRCTNAAVQKEHSFDEYYAKLSNFVAPSWADFKFDKKAILDSMT